MNPSVQWVIVVIAAAAVALGTWIGVRATDGRDPETICRELPNDAIGFACISANGDPETFRVIYVEGGEVRVKRFP